MNMALHPVRVFHLVLILKSGGVIAVGVEGTTRLFTIGGSNTSGSTPKRGRLPSASTYIDVAKISPAGQQSTDFAKEVISIVQSYSDRDSKQLCDSAKMAFVWPQAVQMETFVCGCTHLFALCNC